VPSTPLPWAKWRAGESVGNDRLMLLAQLEGEVGSTMHSQD
jgi:hypothetical protein